ncbi:MAG: RNA polymerase sigma-70 factor [Chitinophagaceae bacterium]|jgi:RNA polymerase sigma-70 factor (ECF subfamily)|nr:RNA polymerase sigma-70 factor [Chitinophagaceae bacterium]MCU0402970.1 RNA polymerase sigma-70 factor [Chitinophagaceae bacterium]
MNESALFADWQHRIAVDDDAQAFLELYRYFRQRLVKFAYSICHVKEDAEDIVEDVFVRIWVRRKSLDQVLNLKLYLYVATRNFSLNNIKLKERTAHLDLDNLKIEISDIHSDPHQHMIDLELAEKIHNTINELPPKCKAIYKLIKEDGLRYKEVAEILHLSPKTVENQLAIAIKRIAVSIGKKEKPAAQKKM